MRVGERQVLPLALRDGKRKRDNVSLSAVQFTGGLYDSGSDVDLQIDIDMAGEQLQQFIIVTHWFAFVDKIADGVIVDKGVDIPSFPDAVEINLRCRWRVYVLVESGPLAGNNDGKCNRNAQNVPSTDPHSVSKYAKPGKLKSGSAAAVRSQGNAISSLRT
jgi:hypothetical protein